MIIKVSLAYCKNGHGRSSTMGWGRRPSREARRIICRIRFATELKSEGVPFAKPTTTLDPPVRFTIQKNGGLARRINLRYPLTPEGGAFGLHNQIEGVPPNRIKGFKIQFEGDGGNGALMTSLDDIRCVDKVFPQGSGQR